MPHLGAFVPSNYFAFIYVPVYKNRALYCERAHPDGYALNAGACFQHYSKRSKLLISGQHKYE